MPGFLWSVILSCTGYIHKFYVACGLSIITGILWAVILSYTGSIYWFSVVYVMSLMLFDYVISQ